MINYMPACFGIRPPCIDIISLNAARRCGVEHPHINWPRQNAHRRHHSQLCLHPWWHPRFAPHRTSKYSVLHYLFHIPRIGMLQSTTILDNDLGIGRIILLPALLPTVEASLTTRGSTSRTSTKEGAKHPLLKVLGNHY